MSSNTGKILGVIVILVILIGAGVYLIANTDTEEQQGTIEITSRPTVANLSPTSSPVPTETESEVPDNWETYQNENPRYSISYPSEMESDNVQQADVRFQLLGPTQTEGTEMFDGISLTIESGSYTADTFQEFVQQEYEDQEGQPTTSEITDLERTTVASVQGYSFQVTSLGDFTHIYLPIDESNYLHIFYLLEDPEEQGFQNTLNTMLSTLELG